MNFNLPGLSIREFSNQPGPFGYLGLSLFLVLLLLLLKEEEASDAHNGEDEKY